MSNDIFQLNQVRGGKVILPTICLETSLYRPSEEQSETILATMDAVTATSDSLLLLLLACRGEAVSVNGKVVSAGDFSAKLSEERDRIKTSMPLDAFLSAARNFYTFFIENSSKSCCGILLNTEIVSKCGPMEEEEFADVLAFCRSGIFPIANTLNSSVRYSVIAEVQKALKSMEEKQKLYDSTKQKWSDALASSKLPNIAAVADFVSKLSKCESLGKFDKASFLRLANAFRGKEGSVANLRSLLLSSDAEFGPEAQEFGYKSDVLNCFLKNRVAWENPDPFTHNSEYVGLIANTYHWQKDFVNIPTFGFYGKKCRINLGENFVKFALKKEENGDFSLTVRPIAVGGKKLELKLARCPHFGPDTKIEMVGRDSRGKAKESKDTPEEAADPKPMIIPRITYTRDSKKKTWYTGTIKEPNLRYDVEKKKFFVAFPVSNHSEVGNDADVAALNESKWFLASAACGKQSGKQFRFDKFRVMGVDMGIETPFVASIWDGEHKDGKLSLTNEVAIVRAHKNLGHERTIERIRGKMAVIKALKSAYNECVGIVCGDKYIRKGSWAEVLGLDRETIIAKAESLKGSDTILAQREIRDSLLPINQKAAEIRSFLSELRSAWQNSKDKALYAQNSNFSDTTVFLKRALIKDFVSLLRLISCAGGAKTEVGEEFAKSYRKWYRGLTRKAGQIASDIINVARHHKVQFVVLEDLDMEQSLFDSRDKNNLRSLWGIGAIYQLIAQKARKHNVAVLAVDPSMTSRFDFATGRLVEEDGRDVFVISESQKSSEVNGLQLSGAPAPQTGGESNRDYDPKQKSDGTPAPQTDAHRENRDTNAARNIALRGISRGADGRKFYAEQLSETIYRVVLDPAKSKMRYSAAMNRFGSCEILLEERDGAVSVVSKTLTADQKKQPPLSSKKIPIVVEGLEGSYTISRYANPKLTRGRGA